MKMIDLANLIGEFKILENVLRNRIKKIQNLIEMLEELELENNKFIDGIDIDMEEMKREINFIKRNIL